MEKIDLNKIKAVAFDFDDTLYTGGDWSRYYKYCSEYLVTLGLGKDADDVFDKLLKLYPNIPNFGTRVCHELQKRKLDVNLMYDFLNENIYDVRSDHMEFFDYKKLNELSKYIPIYVISNSPENYIKKYAKEFGIDLNDFKLVLFNRHNGNDYSKTPYILKCVEDAKVNKDNFLFVGDDLYTDMLAGKNAGVNTLLVREIEDTESLVDELIKINKK